MATESIAYGAGSGGQQVGQARVGGIGQASLWTGTAGSWADLHPAGASGSTAWDADGGQQVGYAGMGGTVVAGLWSGTASSWVNLNPAGATHSQGYGVHGGWQVGFARIGGVDRASLWSGTAGSWEDLSLLVSGSWLDTFAVGVWSDSTTLYVTGWGRSNATGLNEALLWSRPIPSSTTAAMLALAGALAMRRRR